MTLPRRVAIALWVVLPLLVGIGVLRLHFDVEVLDLLPPNLGAVQGLKLYQKHFANARELIIAVSSPGAEHTEAAAREIAQRLDDATNLVASAIWEPPWLEHPGETAELIGYLWFNQPPAVFDQLTNRLAPAHIAATLAETRQELAVSLSPDAIARLSYDPLGLTRLPRSVSGAAPSFGSGQSLFASKDGTFRIIFVEARGALATYRDCQDWLHAIHGVVAAARAEAHLPADVTVRYTGRPAFVAEVSRGMQHDMTISVGLTSVIIGFLFWLAHRRVKPMLWLLTLLALVLVGTLGLGGLIYGRISVVSIGFAAILLGLAVDYAVVHYQEALAHPDLTVPEIRREIAPSIFWAATTTITAFLMLNLGGLPGLGQLGTLVGVGVALAAFVMIFAFLPPLFPERRKPRPREEHLRLANIVSPERGEDFVPPRPSWFPVRAKAVFAATAVFIAFCLVTLAFGIPKMDATANALRPRHSPAYATLDLIQRKIGHQREPVWLLVSGSSASAVARRLDEVKPALEQAVTNGVLSGFTLPTAIWPRPENQAANRALARRLAGQGAAIRAVAQTNGFTDASLALADGILATWRDAAATPGVFWPTNQLDRWIFDKLVARTSTNLFALGLISLPNSGANLPALSKLAARLPQQHVWLSGWELLGHGILGVVMSNLWKLLLPIVVLVLLSLWLAFHRPVEIALSLTILLLSGLFLLAVMHLAGWSWNLLNLMALPLILGTGVDYSIFMQLALRRYHGDLPMAHRSVGRALLLCGGTAVAGFGALTLSTNAGMASLGEVCAVGIASNMLLSVLLLPSWWMTLIGRKMRHAHHRRKG